MNKKILLIFFFSLSLSGCSLTDNQDIEKQAKKEFTNYKKEDKKSISNNGDNIANKGEKVVVNYTGKLQSGEVFDSSHFSGRKPLTFSIGEGQMIPGFEKGVLGMKIGEIKEVNIPPEKAYGKYDEKLVKKIKKNNLKVQSSKLKQGATLRSPQGRQATIKKIGKDTVTVDMNHKLAGKNLIFEIKLLDIKK